MAKKKSEIVKKEDLVIPLHSYEGTKEEQLQRLYDDWFKCQRCQLSGFRCTGDGTELEDIVFCNGNPNSGIMIVGEAPGEEEMKEMIPFVGRSGKLLNQILASTSGDQEVKEAYMRYQKGTRSKAHEEAFHNFMFQWRSKNFFITNIVGCRPPENRTPIPPEIKACSERLLNLIYIVDPILIIASGKTAAEALIGKKVEITMKRGEMLEMQMKGKFGMMNYPVMATLHPSFLLRKADWNVPGGDYSKTMSDYMQALRVYDFLSEKHYGTVPPNRGIT